MIRVSCFVKNRWPRLAVALPGNVGGPVNLFRCLRLRHGSGITGHEKRLFSPDAMHTGAEKTRLKGFSTNRYRLSHVESIKAVIRVSCFVIREKPLAGLGVALPGTAGRPVNLAFVCATDQAS